jgi:hypothetical protein
MKNMIVVLYLWDRSVVTFDFLSVNTTENTDTLIGYEHIFITDEYILYSLISR